MSLRSRLLSGDPKLEAAAISDAAHIVTGTTGPHVRKIQLALIQLDGANIVPDGVYGLTTAAAVLAYKQKRNIINRSYQTSADNIVGRMTISALDAELLGKELPLSGITRIMPIFPIALPSRPPTAFGFGSGLPRVQLFGENLKLDAGSLSASVPGMQLHSTEIGKITVLNGIGKRLVCRHSVNGLVFDPEKPESQQAGSVEITKNPQVFHIRARDPGQTEIVIIGTPGKPLGEIGLTLSIVPSVFIEVKTFFHFLDGPKGIKTNRTPNDLNAILKTMNDIYGAQASMRFINSGVNPSLKIASLGREVPGVRASQFGSTPDTKAIKANQNASILFNVFFFGRFITTAGTDGTQPDFLALTSRPPNDDKPLRCCLCRDAQEGDPSGIDAGKTLAHEAGHALGEDDDDTDTDSLMFFSQSGQTNTRIVPLMAQRLQTSFTQFPP
jgi:peptidoglycan hydrolase-like protein with peptidoglycan-binding domain